MAITVEGIKEALGRVVDPDVKKDILSLGLVSDIAVNGLSVSFTVALARPVNRAIIDGRCKREVTHRYPDVLEVKINYITKAAAPQTNVQAKAYMPAKYVIAVASGKGGVGKSSTTVNLAYALTQTGARVGILDTDIYGPNIPHLLGLSNRPTESNSGAVVDGNGPTEGKLNPAFAHGIHAVSVGYMIPDGHPLVWRGPMLHSAIGQLLNDFAWPELDFLLIDMPPGTGDAQMSAAELLNITGAVIVTSPQNVAIADATRGIEAFHKLEVPIIGLIENMAGEIFGSGGGEAAAQRLNIPFIGRVPLDGNVRHAGDAGKPLGLVAPDSEAAKALVKIAADIAARAKKIVDDAAQLGNR